ncbi:MAG TPA: phosphoglucomutase/phosphomannomutase family protein [bacterium]|nr:phosphoglucomutase/phosphomannomutase family protein [bacterium]
MDKIKFGTSGWRAIIADDFTFSNVKVCVQAIAEHLKSKRLLAKPVVIGADPRFLAEEFMKTAAEVLAANAIESIICPVGTPTPVISYEILSKKLAGGINFTASHNPPYYQGIKFSPSWGGPALPGDTQFIENEANRLIQSRSSVDSINFLEAVNKKLVKTHDPRKDYLKKLKSMLMVNQIKKSKLKVGLDMLYGSGIGYLDSFLKDVLPPVFTLNNYRDVLFGGSSPEPSEENLGELKKELKAKKCHLGLSVDGDADRFGIIDTDGSFISPNEFLALVLNHLIKTRKWKGVVARSVMTSHMVDSIASKNGITVKETPVGFKYIGEIMTQEEFIVGGEESGGLTIKGHVPEKDGILAALLALEIMAVEKKPLKKVLAELSKQYGTYITKRINLRVSLDTFESLKTKLSLHPPTSLGEFHVKRIVETDGYKFILKENSWVGVRFSGTEPVLRIYIETDDPKKVEKLEKFSRQVFVESLGKKKK